MKLTWNGHACFTIQTQDSTLVLDPYQDGTIPGLSNLRLKGDAVLCSHGHYDHDAVETVELSGKPLQMDIEEFLVYHDDQKGAIRGQTMVRIISAEGLRVAHMGDVGCRLEPEELDRLQDLDALLVPVGGYYTINAAMAYELVQAVKPRVVIPMHYRGEEFGYDVLAKVDDYLALCGNGVTYDGNTLELTKDTPAQTAVLTYQK
ncbi:MAG: MBL fold metallo-hydrolase [Clostridium sp.]|nr:MBL fold metallo-hydrolase [Clostridium sp.]